MKFDFEADNVRPNGRVVRTVKGEFESPTTTAASAEAWRLAALELFGGALPQSEGQWIVMRHCLTAGTGKGDE